MQNICINKMLDTGPEIIASYPPDYFSDSEKKEISLKTIPLNAKNGDFTTLAFKDDLVIASYVFTIKENPNSRPDLLAICASIESNNFNPMIFKDMFSSLIQQLKDSQVLTSKTIVALVSNLYRTLSEGKTEIKITKTTTIKVEISSDNLKEIEKAEKKKKKLQEKMKGVW